MRRATAPQMWALAALALTICLSTNVARAQPRLPRIRDTQVYIKMDFWESPDQQGAAAWHKDPNNGNQWTQLPNDLTSAKPRARFPLKRLFVQSELEDAHIWFLGVPSVKVVRGSPENFEDVSGDRRYSEMIDRMVIAADPSSTGMTAYDPCGSRIWPIFTGSELTPYLIGILPDRTFGMRMRQAIQNQPDGLLFAANWGWRNPAEMEEEDVYIEFTLRFDLHDTNTEFTTYFRTHVSWISAGGGCGYTFCLTPEQTTALKVGTPHLLLNGNHWLVAAVPHILDHTAALHLYKRRGTQNTLLVNSAIGNLNGNAAAHKCDPDGEEIGWHTHSSGQTGHLSVGGLSAALFAPLELLEGWAGDEVLAAAAFDIPEHTVSAPTDHRALYMVFWTVIDPGGP